MIPIFQYVPVEAEQSKTKLGPRFPAPQTPPAPAKARLGSRSSSVALAEYGENLDAKQLAPASTGNDRGLHTTSIVTETTQLEPGCPYRKRHACCYRLCQVCSQLRKFITTLGHSLVSFTSSDFCLRFHLQLTYVLDFFSI